MTSDEQVDRPDNSETDQAERLRKLQLFSETESKIKRKFNYSDVTSLTYSE